MMDACDASWNAVKYHFPSATILMCWFHVKFNVKKHHNLLPNKEAIAKVDLDIDLLHNCVSYQEFIIKKDSILRSWQKNRTI